MTRLRAIVYCCISFVLATFLHWLTANVSFMHGSIVRGALLVEEEKDFWEAMKHKVTYERNGFKFCPNTHTKEILVVEKKNKKRLVKDSPVSYGVGSR